MSKKEKKNTDQKTKNRNERNQKKKKKKQKRKKNCMKRWETRMKEEASGKESQERPSTLVALKLTLKKT